MLRLRFPYHVLFFEKWPLNIKEEYMNYVRTKRVCM